MSLEDNLKFIDLFRGKDFIPLIGAPIHIHYVREYPKLHLSFKNILKEGTYTGIVFAWQVPFYSGLGYLLYKIFN